MYCEKCGKLNPEGAMFCSNCSSILRSRRSVAQPTQTPKPAESKHIEDATRRISVSDAVKPETEAPKAKSSDWEERFSAPKSTYQTKRAPIPEPTRRRPSYYANYEEESTETVKFCSAWCNVLSVVSWIIFIALMATGILGGAVLIILGIKQSESMMYFAGTAIMILFVVIALAYHAKNMVQIKILKKFNEKK